MSIAAATWLTTDELWRSSGGAAANQGCVHMKKIVLAAAVAAASLVGATSASALTFAFGPGGASPLPGLTVIQDFENVQPGDITGVGFQIKVPPSDANGAVIPNSTFPGPHYLSVLGGGSATISFASYTNRFSIDWGSLDTYNTLRINLAGGGFVNVVPGTTIVNTPANGNQILPTTNGVFSVVGSSGESFTSITLTSSQNSFEIDNLATGAPEPAAWAMMITGFGLAGAMIRRRRAVVA